MRLNKLKNNITEILNQIDNKTHTNYAEEIMKQYRIKTISDTKEMLFYNNGTYVPNVEILIEEECQKRIYNCSTFMCLQVIKGIQRSTYTERKNFDEFPHLINLKNGIFNIITGIFSPHNPNILFRIQFPIVYDRKIGPENFMKFMLESVPDFKDRITIFEEMGSILLGGLKLEKIYMHQGDGENGKSTFFSVIEAFCGDENTCHISIHDLINHRFARSGLDGKLLNTYAEISNNELSQLGIVKAFVSGDPVDVERKGQHAFTLRNRAKMFFSANELPKIDNFKEAELRRFLLTQWKQQFKADPNDEELKRGIKKRDIELKTNLTTQKEFSGILNLVIFHAKKLLQNKKFTYDQRIEHLEKEWKQKIDDVRSFSDKHLIRKEGMNYPKSLLYENYKKWCEEKNMIPKSMKEFNSRIKENFGDDRVLLEGKTTVVWKGMNLNHEFITQLLKLHCIQSEKQMEMF
jgi:putative DNA primase/helicase